MDDYTQPHWSRSVFMTVDVQRDFSVPGAPGLVTGTPEIIPTIQRLLTAYRLVGLPIIHVIRLYLQDGSNVDLCRRARIEGGARIVVPGTEGSNIVKELLPSPDIVPDSERLLRGDLQLIGNHEWLVYKPRWGAFYRTVLEEHLLELEVDTVVFSGCNFPNCPRTSMYEASERDFRVVLVLDAVSGVYDLALEELRGIGVNIVTAEKCLNAVGSLGLTS
jgi:nicotinamidase-related amidase